MKEINRLRFRFILFNMLLVTAVLAAAMFAGTLLVKRQAKSESSSLLSRAVSEEMERDIFEAASYVRIPYFSVVVKQDGTVTLLDGVYNSFQGEDFLERVAVLGLESGLETGELEEYHLRFRRASHPAGYLLAFADTSYEDSMRDSMLRNMAIICGGVWAGLFIISCFFAKWAVKPVEDSVRRQKQFVADASHELKTPLTVIAANAELLSGRCRGISSDVDKWIGNMNQECREMKKLIESLLLLARSDLPTSRGKMPHSCNLSDLAAEEVLVFEPVFFQNRKSVTAQIAEDIQIRGNEDQIRQLLKILLDNAVKYSAPGKTTEVVLKKSGRYKACLQVTSRGEPIPESERKVIFNRFYRGDTARSSGQGYGLGLAIASEITHKCRARIGVEALADGNCFYVVFRLGQFGLWHGRTASWMSLQKVYGKICKK